MHQHQNAPQFGDPSQSDGDENEIADEIDEIIEEIRQAARSTPPPSSQ
jgi:hypothetical protein